ncbi:class I SAM-dependent methyltransferase [Dictyobacter formicarum]|uniref:class I SAM-dependent methyltransferase n=1 Tax=Dictyobacter formicarum TaxID=2778368 RepID=UPI0019159148|nr:class I SAM-dependent methyltransferase [Dictyobacter formicarum]
MSFNLPSTPWFRECSLGGCIFVHEPRVCFEQGDIRHLPEADQTFDAVVCIWVIETLDDPRAAVSAFVQGIKLDSLVLATFCRLPNNRLGNALQTSPRMLALPQS